MPQVIRWLRRDRRHLDRPTGPPNPFEAFLFIACIVQGIGAVTGYADPAAFQGAIPAWARTGWGVLLLLGGSGATAGLYWPWDPVDGVLIKRAAMIALAGATLAYGVAGFATPARLFVGATFNIAFGAACIVRIKQVTSAIADVHHGMRKLREDWEGPP